MPALEKTLPKDDLGYLKIVASFWGVELTSNAPAQAAEELSAALCDAELLEEVVGTLPDEAQTALGVLADSGGRLPWETFTRRFGELREIGPGKRDREKPHLRPISATETLWYRALLARAFFETERGPQEFAFIPDDLLEALAFIGFKSEEPLQQSAPPKALIPEDKPLGRPATPAEKTHIQTASDGILEEITTLLAAIRTNRPIPALGLYRPFALDLLTVCRILDRSQPETASAPEAGALNPDALKRFFESTRAEALTLFTQAWHGSPDLDELRQHPDLLCEGGWRNDPLRTRTFLFDLMALIPKNQWWSLTALLRDLKAAHPDFQRSGGEYDTWFIKRRADGLYLRGFAHWDDVEGSLVRYFVQILHWLGLADVASAQENGLLTAFRLLAQAETREENGKITVTSNGRISVPRLTPRSARYQVARFCEWEEPKAGGDYRYRATPDSLKAAHAQGLKAGQLLSLLAKNASALIPPPFVKALQRWEVNGTEARIEHPVVLRVSRPEVMSELKNSKAGRFLSEPLGPTTAVVKPGAESKILEALSEMGLLAETSGLKEE
ncbi:MAG: hypothetical protein R6W69_02290 [Anaerolineales bacterium]